MVKNRKRNRIISIGALVIVLVMIAALFTSLNPSHEKPAQPGVDLPVIPPSESDTTANKTVRLYFRCNDQPYLSTETRKVDVHADERLEAAVLRELYKGPASSKPELEALIHPQTRTISLTDSGDTLSVTISAEFLQPAKPLPENWAEDLVLREEAMLRRRLAVYSVVNTLTELGRYANVQILIDLDGMGIGKNLQGSSFGFTGIGISEKPLEAMSFQSKVVLNAQNTLDFILRCAIEKNWTDASRFVSVQPEAQQANIAEATDLFAAANADLVQYSIADFIAETGGEQAVVFVNAQYRAKTGETYQRKSVPIRMELENELWKAAGDSLNRFLNVIQ